MLKRSILKSVFLKPKLQLRFNSLKASNATSTASKSVIGDASVIPWWEAMKTPAMIQLENFSKEANGGDVKSMVKLADCYSKGDGITKDESMAFK